VRFINLDHSPYAARVKIQIMHKQAPIDIIAPPLSLKTPEFLAKFPLGKIPLLALDNGDYLPESIAIMEYIEDSYPEVVCRPKNAIGKAKMRVMMAYTDTHLGPALLPFFKALLIPDFEFNKQAQFKILCQTLEKFDRWLYQNNSQNDQFYKANIDLGDMTLVPIIWYVNAVVPLFYKGDAFTNLKYLNQWSEWVNRNEAVTTVIEAMDKAFNAFIKSI